MLIRGFPDHALFREMSVTTCLVRQVWGFLSLTLCIKANFDPLQLVKYDVTEKGLNIKTIYGLSSYPYCNSLHILYNVYFENIIED